MKYSLFQDHFFLEHSTKKLFQYNQLSKFEELWAMNYDWFEEPNYSSNGWSGVTRHTLTTEKNDTIPVFIKRQENYNDRSLLHPLRGIPTFRLEFNNIQKLINKEIPTLTSLYYGERNIKGKSQSILITLALEGYQSIEDFFQSEKQASQEKVQNIMQLAGQITRSLHEANYRHGSLYPKHFFVKADADKVDVRLIDLEKLKWHPLKNRIRYNDLSRLIRHGDPRHKQAMLILIDSYLKYGHDLSHSSLARKLSKLLNI